MVVPGLGGFVLQYRPAAIAEGVFMPPGRMPGFNPQLQYDDGVLAAEIARNECLTLQSAQNYIRQHVEYLCVKLTISEYVAVGRMGSMTRTPDGRLEFVPNRQADFLPDNFALSEIPLSLYENKQTGPVHNVHLRISAQNIRRYAAAVILLLGLLLMPSPEGVKQADYADLLKTSQNFLLQQEEKTLAEEEIPQNIDDPKNFHVVVSETSNLIAAEALCRQLQGEGFGESGIIRPNKTYLVIIQSCPDVEAAIEYMRALRQTDKRFEDTWVLFYRK